MPLDTQTPSDVCDTPPTPTAEDGARHLDPPNIITNVLTTDATVPDAAATATVHTMLAERGLAPAEHYLDAGYPSAALVLSSKAEHGIDLVAPLLADTSAQARAGTGYDRAAFTFDHDAKQATCPQGKTSATWNPARQRASDAIVVSFARADCESCPARALCTSAKSGRRQITVPPREIHEVQQAARAEQNTKAWQAKYAVRAGVEGTIRQAVTVTGIRRARYRGLDKTRLDHVLCATALNLIRLDAYWNGHALNRTRTSHLTRLGLSPAA